MKNIIKISLMAIVVGALLNAKNIKKYEIKSAKIEYAIKGSRNILGIVKTEISGKKKLIFDNYGRKRVEEESKVSKEIALGNIKIKKSHTLYYLNGHVIYNVDFNKKRIIREENSVTSREEETLLKKRGRKRIGSDTIMGYDCDIWNFSGEKQCIYKGIPLRIESTTMGLKRVEIATKVVFDISLDKKDFQLPNYPVFNFDIDMMMAGEKPKKLDKSRLEKMDKRANEAKEVAW
jgi:hypothetical protein